MVIESQAKAIVLRSVDYGDADRILSLMTLEHGRVDVFARGIRRSKRRFSGHLDLFTLVQVQLKKTRSRYYLKDAEVLEAFLGIREDIERLAWGAAFSELCLRLFGEWEPNDRAYSTLVHALVHLSTAKALNRGVLYLFELKLLAAAGLIPAFDQCVNCGAAEAKAGPYQFHAHRGGILCRACLPPGEGLAVGLATLRLVSRGLEFDENRLERLQFSSASLKETHQLLSAFVGYHVGGRFKAHAYLESLL